MSSYGSACRSHACEDNLLDIRIEIIRCTVKQGSD